MNLKFTRFGLKINIDLHDLVKLHRFWIPAGGPDHDRIRVLVNSEAVKVKMFGGFFKEETELYKKHFRTHDLHLFGYKRRRWPDRRFNLYLLFFIIQKY